MVINLRNQHLDPLVAFIKRAMVHHGVHPNTDERNAIVELFALIEQVKKSAHYKLYLRDLAEANAAAPPPNDRSAHKRAHKKRGRK